MNTHTHRRHRPPPTATTSRTSRTSGDTARYIEGRERVLGRPGDRELLERVERLERALLRIEREGVRDDR